ncbi:arylsulfatase [Actinoplanes sp. TRM 88003]|uniref:Arylsulfatase n=1 Tax=Paractinoplanes aksuensis TaxID=2939490 RepID=A0ABT1E165_9ACTN|nr:arylsulfatase [Actinoplanes aksuensis]MCO8275905.1 arylsulfatase [Actinoplanes aksuensis]
MGRAFRGVINLDVRDSVADWETYTPARAPAGAPNVLLVLYDDTGPAAWEPFGGRIAMPVLGRLAADGLRYSQWHTAGLGPATRSCLLTGRHHHENAYAGLTGAATGFPGSHGRIPREHVFLAEVLRRHGWGTFWLGKNHNVPVSEHGPGATRENWPAARGFDRFYGFLGGQTDQWHPSLVSDNHRVEPWGPPEPGYHLSEDLAGRAVRFLRDLRQSAPDKPWFMIFAPAAGHTPHQAPREWIDRYRGRFDDGYDAYRHWALPRMIERGVLPAGTQLAPAPPRWDSLPAEQRRLSARTAEVYAGFADHTDQQVGRVVDHLAATGELATTLVIVAAVAGATGTAGWAQAFSTPFRGVKRDCHEGGVCAPLVVHWPAGIRARGEVRHQYHHAVDIVPTVLHCCGVPWPEDRPPLPGVSLRYSFDAPQAPGTRHTQYYAVLGGRALWHDGWKAVAEHPPASGRGRFDHDRWQLFHTDTDRSEAHDLAAARPEKVQELVNIWFREAERFAVLPLDDRTVAEVLLEERAEPAGPSTRTFHPDAASVPGRDAPDLRGRSFRITCEVELEDAAGILVAQGGHALFVKDQRLWYINQQQLVSDDLPTGRCRLGVEFAKERIGDGYEAIGTARLLVNDRIVAGGPMRTRPGPFSPGPGLSVGRHSGEAVSDAYRPPFPFTGGRILRVEVTTGADQQVDLAREAATILADE